MNTGSLGTHPGTSVNHNRFLGRCIARVGSRRWTPECLDIHPVEFFAFGNTWKVRCVDNEQHHALALCRSILESAHRLQF